MEKASLVGLVDRNWTYQKLIVLPYFIVIYIGVIYTGEQLLWCVLMYSLTRSHYHITINNRLALKSGIDGHSESPQAQVGHSRPANTAQRLNSVYVVASSD